MSDLPAQEYSSNWKLGFNFLNDIYFSKYYQSLMLQCLTFLNV